MPKTFPVHHSHQDVRCHKCGELLSGGESVSGYPEGRFSKRCGPCGLTTFYDVTYNLARIRSIFPSSLCPRCAAEDGVRILSGFDNVLQPDPRPCDRCGRPGGALVTLTGDARREALDKVFELVRCREDWRAPIRAYVTAEDVPAVREAVRHFTATELRIVGQQPDGRLRVEADGYRMGPAGP